jgi:hypothetical protein
MLSMVYRIEFLWTLLVSTLEIDAAKWMYADEANALVV